MIKGLVAVLVALGLVFLCRHHDIPSPFLISLCAGLVVFGLLYALDRVRKWFLDTSGIG